MKIFITGATGYIGQQLALRLADEGNTVVALVRNMDKAGGCLQHPNIILAKGDLLDTESLCSAMRSCDAVYHLAALASVWHKNSAAFNEFNVGGLERILNCCLKLGIKDVVFTSSAGVVGHSCDSKPVREYTNIVPFLETAYERSKVDAESLIGEYCAKGLRGIIVNPSRVYGPGLLTESNGVTRLIKMYIRGKWHILPGNGQSIGNYVYIDDVVNGHILAMAKARPGERYLLGGENTSFSSFFKSIDQLTNTRHWLFPFPLSLMLVISKLSLFIAENTGRQPLITPPFVRKYHKHWILSSAKAMEELGYQITPLSSGLKKTIEWLRINKSL
jgi:nucleoside-diphosphate-sugar epimerase